MSTLLDRIRAALANDYLVEEEIARGGMAAVFRARDKRLERIVAIKVVKPELATARMVERFTREARLLANLNHPRIVPIYTAGETDGLFYYVMPFIPGETLESRLARGPMHPREARRVIGDVLEALAAAHRMDVVHRDVNARNVFIVNGRAMLGDFGLAASQHEPTTAGTIGSMSPEQSRGDAVGVAGDVYAAGALLYRALTGRPFAMTVEDDRSVWEGVPRELALILSGALAWKPEDRFDDAESFARALRPVGRGSMIAGAAGVVLVVGLFALFVRTRAPDPSLALSDMAILPFEVEGPKSLLTGSDVTTALFHRLQTVPGLTLTSPNFVFRWFANSKRNYQQLRAHYYITGALVTRGDNADVTVTVLDQATLPYATLRVSGKANAVELADSVALVLLQRLRPRVSLSATSPIATRDVDAALAFFQGESDFRRGAWHSAEEHYRAAMERDSTFLLATWRWVNVRRWMPIAGPMPDIDLPGLYAHYGHVLSELDRALIRTQIAPPGLQRFALLDSAVRRFPRDGYAALFYGDEIFHRGALAGYSPERALSILEQAAELDQYLAPAHEHIAWAAIRLGRGDVAKHALEAYANLAKSADTVDVFSLPLLQQGFIARFDSAHAEASLRDFFDVKSPAGLMALRAGAHAGLMLALPHTQLLLGEWLAHAPLNSGDRASGHDARGLAFLTLGRSEAGLAQIDSAAAISGNSDFEIERDEWRLVGATFGWPMVSAKDAIAARSRMNALTRNPLLAERARWALTFDTTSRQAASDPFGRAVQHLRRARALRARGDDAGAEETLRWVNNLDLRSWPEGPAQAAEIDWVFTLPALSLRAEIARARGDEKAACARRAEALQLLRGSPMPAGLFNNVRCGS